jgi:hypothetical protein
VSKNPHRITVTQALAEAGFASLEDFVDSGAGSDSVVPAACDEGCEVEPDGICPHGCKSVLLILGYI